MDAGAFNNSGNMRKYFAAHVVTGLCTGLKRNKPEEVHSIVQLAFAIADEMVHQAFDNPPKR
jgi:hypothetical protein